MESRSSLLRIHLDENMEQELSDDFHLAITRRLSPTAAESFKTGKTMFQQVMTSKKRRFLRFSGCWKSQNCKNDVSAGDDEQKKTIPAFQQMMKAKKWKKTTFPNFGILRKWRKWRFPILGSRKNHKNNVSQLWEHKKRVKGAFPKLGTQKIVN